MSTFANSEDPDEMQHNAAFHQGLHCLLKVKKIFRQKKTFVFFIAALWSQAEKGRTSWLLFVISCCHFPMWYPGSGVVLDCIDP